MPLFARYSCSRRRRWGQNVSQKPRVNRSKDLTQPTAYTERASPYNPRIPM